MTYDQLDITKITYVNMGVKLSVSTFKMQPPASKLSEVYFNILNLKNKKWSNFLCIFWIISFVFPICFGPDENQQQIKRNFRNLLFIYMVMTSTKKKKIAFWICWATLPSVCLSVYLFGPNFSKSAMKPLLMPGWRQIVVQWTTNSCTCLHLG